MASLNKIAYRILEAVRANIGADDSIDIRQIKYDIGIQRAVLIRNELNQNRTINQDIVQSLGCIETEAVIASACCEAMGECSIIRTSVKIPPTIEQHGKDTITRVGGPNFMDSGFQYVSYDRALVSGNGRFNSKIIYAFPFDGYIYLKQSAGTIAFKSISVINVMGVFEDPNEAKEFAKCDGDPCFTDDDPYPIADWMISYLHKILIAEYLGTEAVNQSDESLNNRSDSAQVTKK